MITRNELVGMLAGSLIAGMTMMTLQVAADQDGIDQVSKQIPYSGVLELDGAAVTGTGEEGIWMRFDILDEGVGERPVVYSQTLRLDVLEGHFTALLGPTADDGETALTEVIANADQLTIQTTVLGEHNPEDPASTEGDDIVMSNPQPLSLSPYAIWATHATNFNVANTISATAVNAATVTTADVRATNIDTATLAATGNVILGGDLRPTSGEQLFDGRLRVTNNVADSNGGADAEDEFQVTLWDPSYPTGRYGFGIMPSTLFGNIGDNNSYRFYENGNTILMDISPAETSIQTPFTLDGALTLTNGAMVSDDNNALVINDSEGARISGNGDLNVTGDITLQESGVIVPTDPFNDDINITGDAQMSGDVFASSDGNLNAGFYVKRCNSSSSDTFDCLCNAGNEFAIGGGGWGNASDDSGLRESRPIYTSNRWGWRVTCIDTGGQGSGRDEHCDQAYVICARLFAY